MIARRVVVTGLGPVTPIGCGAEAFWTGLLEKRCGLRRIRAFDPSRFDSQIGGEIDGVAVADYVPKSYRKSAKVMARDIVLAVAAAYHAVRDAGLRTRCIVERGEATGEAAGGTSVGTNVDSTRFGANIGAGLICADLNELAEALHGASRDGVFDMARWGAEGMNALTPLWLLKFLPNMLACHVTIVHDAQAPSNTITCGEASSHLAIGEAFRTIERGAADICICGGAESKANPMALLRQSLGKRLTTRNESPATAVRPFCTDADGTAISEGAGLVILEELGHARARGARIYAELVGFGASNDAFGPSQFDPSGAGVALACEKALRDAGCTAGDVGAVMTFGSAIPARDRAEALGLRQVFGERLGEIPVLTDKASLGNNGAGSGALDFIAAVLAMHHATIPPAVNAETLNPEFGLKVVTGDPVDAKLDVVLTEASALNGGQNAALVIRRFRED